MPSTNLNDLPRLITALADHQRQMAALLTEMADIVARAAELIEQQPTPSHHDQT